MKAEYDLSTMKRRGHPLRKKIERGEFKPLNPLDTPDIETKLSALAPDERELVTEFLELSYPVEKKIKKER